MVRRRRFLAGLGAAGAGVGPAVRAASSARVDVPARVGSAGPADGAAVDRAAADPTIDQHTTVGHQWDDDAFRFEFSYSLPDTLVELRIEFTELGWLDATVEDSTNLERDGETLVWDGGPDPAATVRHEVDDSGFREDPQGYTSGESAMSPTVTTYLRWRYRDESPEVVRTRSFDGEGFLTRTWTLAGAHDLHERTVAGRPLRVVAPTETDPEPGAVLDVFEAGEHRLVGRLETDHVTAFVLPAGRLGVAGWTARDSMALDERAAAVDVIDNVPAHEYCHVLFGVYGGEETYWLREGVAEYFGHLLSLNAGVGSFREFRSTVTTKEEYVDAVLADHEAVIDSRADYEKGAHVLAALDAEIRSRSGGDGMLLDVVTTDSHDLSTHGGFADAVVEAGDDAGLRDWLDRYVRSSDLPEIPGDRDRFELPWQGDEPTPTATATPSPTSTPTPSPTRTPRPTDSPTPSPTARDDADTSGTEEDEESGGLGAPDETEEPGASVPTPGFGLPAAVGGGLLAALLARRRDGDQERAGIPEEV